MIERKELLVAKFGIAFSLLSILFGLGLGLTFGAAEDSLKQGLKQRGQAVLEKVYKGDKKKMSAVVKKSWSYYKRAHLHAGAMGTTALAMCLFLSCLGLRRILVFGLSLCVGVGSFFYGIFWFIAGWRAPGLGSTSLAKESLNWLAIPSAGLYGLGLIITTAFFVKWAFLQGKDEEAKS